MASSLLQIAFGTLKQEKVYKDMDWSTDEIRVALPAWDNNFALQP